MIKSFLKDSAIYMAPTFLSRGLSLILIPLYTRVLQPADFGSLDLFLIFASIVNLTIALEVSQGVARFFAAENDPQKKIAYASSAFWFTFACYIVFTLLMLILSPLVSIFVLGRTGLQLAFQIGIIYIFFNGLFYFVTNQFRWEQRSKHYAIVSLLMPLITSVSSIFLCYFHNWGLLGLLIGMVVGCLSSTVLGLLLLRNTLRFRFDLGRLKEMLAFSAPLVFSGIAVWLSLYVDRMMINYFLSVNDVGLYGIGYRLASIAGLVMVGFQGALTPLVYASYKKPDTPRQLERIFRIFLAFALFIFLALTLFAKDILILFSTPAYYGGSSLVIFLVPAVLLSNMYIFSPGISIAKKTHLIVFINIGGGFVSVLMSFLLISRLGILGAAMATMLTYLAIFIAYTVIGNHYYPIPHNWLRNLSAASLAGALAFLVPRISQVDSIRYLLSLSALAIFVPSLFIIGLFRRAEFFASLQYAQHRLLSSRSVSNKK
jgi:O-antigen/teichoic acid export membrane protein